MTYLQIAKNGTDIYCLSYQTGSIKNHFISKPSKVNYEDTYTVLKAYYSNRPFKGLLKWETVDFAEKKSVRIANRLFLFGILIGVILYVMKNDIEEYYFYEYFQTHRYEFLILIPLYLSLPAFYFDLKNKNWSPIRGLEDRTRAICMFLLTFIMTLAFFTLDT